MKKIAVSALLGGAIISAGLTACTSLPASGEPTAAPTIAVATEAPAAPPASEAPLAFKESTFTPGQENAIKKAESYLDYSAFSRQGLIEQLEYEEFSPADATFAVDHVTVDWNEQAVKKAESYLDYSSFSKQGLIEQLEYEGFTQAQAQYGADAAYGS